MWTGLDSKCAQGAILRRVLLPAAILFVADLLQPIDVLAVDGLLDGDVVMAVVAARRASA